MREKLIQFTESEYQTIYLVQDNDITIFTDLHEEQQRFNIYKDDFLSDRQHGNLNLPFLNFINQEKNHFQQIP